MGIFGEDGVVKAPMHEISRPRTTRGVQAACGGANQRLALVFGHDQGRA